MSTAVRRPVDQAQATRLANATAPIRFDQPRDQGMFAGGKPSPWVNKVKELVAGVVAGVGNVGEFYKLGEFTAVSGARTAIRNLASKEDRLGLPDGVQVEFQVSRAGSQGSELWAAVHRDTSSPDE